MRSTTVTLAAFSALLGASGCSHDPDHPNDAADAPVAIFPPSITMTAGSGRAYSFTASGGTAPYRYEVVSGPGTIDAVAGLYTTSPEPGTTEVAVFDSTGQASSAIVSNVRLTTNGDVFSTVTDGVSQYLGGSFSTVYPFLSPDLIALDPETGAPELAFDVQSGFGGFASEVSAIVPVGDALYIAGSFSAYRGEPVQNLIKVDAKTGVRDPTFQTAGFDANSSLVALAVSGSSLYIGGGFATYGGQPAMNLAKLDAVSGELDTAFTQTTGPNYVVSAISVSGSSVYVGGLFTSYRSSPARALVKLDATSGDPDPSFMSQSGMDEIDAFATSGSSIYVVGGTGGSNSVAKLDATTGARDVGFAGEVESPVNAIVANDTAIYVGGQFSSYDGQPTGGLAKIDITSGALDTAFAQEVALIGNVYGLLVVDGSLYVAGNFTSHHRDGQPRGVVKIDGTSGSLDPTFGQTVPYADGVFGSVLAIAGSTLFVGGNFNTYGGVPAQSLAKLDASTWALDTTFTQPTGPDGLSALALSKSALYIAGITSTYRGRPVRNLAKVDLTTGALDTSFSQPATWTGMDQQVSNIALSGTSLYIAGTFASYRGHPVLDVAKLDATTGALDQAFTPDRALERSVSSENPLVVSASGAGLYVAATVSVGGQSVSGTVKLNATTGALDRRFAVIPGATPLAATDTSLYLAGLSPQLTKVDGATGAVDTVFTNPVGFDGGVLGLVVAGSSLYVGGSFTSYRGQAENGLAKLDGTTGALDPAFNYAGSFLSLPLAVVGSSLSVDGSFPFAGAQMRAGALPVDLVTGAPR